MKRRIEALERVEKVFIPAWDDFIVQVGASRLPASAAPAVVSYLGTEVLSFSKTATNTMPFNVQIPHSYQAGTAIELHCHVVYPNAGTGNSIWQATYNWANIDGLFDASSTTGALATAASPDAARSHNRKDALGSRQEIVKQMIGFEIQAHKRQGTPGAKLILGNCA
jgi:hypothetical protein